MKKERKLFLKYDFCTGFSEIYMLNQRETEEIKDTRPEKQEWSAQLRMFSRKQTEETIAQSFTKIRFYVFLSFNDPNSISTEVISLLAVTEINFVLKNYLKLHHSFLQ